MHDFKVALISHEYPPFEIGGIGVHCYDLANSLSRKGVNTLVVCGNSSRSGVEKPNDLLTVIRLPNFNVPPRYFWFQVQNLRVMRKLVADCTIIHGVNPISSAVVAYYKRFLNKPFVVTCHQSNLREMKEYFCAPSEEWTIGNLSISAISYPLNQFLVDICFKSADRIIVPGLSTLEYILDTDRNLDIRKTSIIYNGIDFDKINRITDVLCEDCGENSFSIAFFGRLVSHKGIMHLLEAMYILALEFPNLRLHVFGKGPLLNKIRLRVLSLDLQSRVKLFGHVPYEQLIKQISRASVVVLPSLTEVGPFIAALEAMACKKPLVVFDTPFSREFVRNMQNGILAAAGDSKDLAAKIRILLVNEELRRKIGQDAYKYVRENHDWSILVDKYIEIYKELVQY